MHICGTRGRWVNAISYYIGPHYNGTQLYKPIHRQQKYCCATDSVWCQAIICTNDDLLLIEPLGTNHLNLNKYGIIFINKANLRDLIAATGLVISNWIQIVNFSARVTVKFDGWPCKTIGQLFYATSSFVHLFVPIGEFKLKLQSGNAQSGSNWMIFRAVRPWNLTDDLAKQ